MDNHDEIEVVTNAGEAGLLWVGNDDRGLELEVIAVIREEEDLLLVIHVMPTGLREK